MIRFEMNRKQEAILAAIILIGALGVFILYTGIGRTPDPVPEPPPAEPPPPTLLETVTAHIQYYTDIYEQLTAQFEAGTYTLDNPLISINPYGANPLAALIFFETEQASQISIYIKGTTEDTNISRTLPGYKTTHIIEVYGLYPNTVNYAEITATEQGTKTQTTAQLLLPAGPVPPEFPLNLIHSRAEQPAAGQAPPAGGNPELTFTFAPLSAFDRNGDYRWAYSGFGTIYPVSYNEGGTIHMIVGSFETNDALLISIDMMGRVFDAVPVGSDYQPAGHGPYYTQPGYLYQP